jgi:soluble lytic murein transglycosylase-like protein
VGLVIAGTAAPIAIQRYETVTRNDPQHERLVLLPMQPRMDDEAVAEAWRTAEQQETQTAAAADREQTIAANLDRYSEYKIPRELAEQIYDNAIEAEVDPDLAFGLVHAESSFRNSATSHVGAVGLTQLMPRTAEWLEPGVSRSQLRNPDVNLRIGFGYLKSLVDKYDGNTKLALLAYNRGPGTVDRVLKRGGNPDNGYEDLVNKRRS